MKILFIAPLPPPIHGQSLAAKILLDELKNTNEVFVVNSKESFTKNHLSFLYRIFEVIKLLCIIIETQKKSDLIYLQISESLLGNIKDLMIYWICRKKLSTMYIHLHGGSLKRLLFDKNKWLVFLNKYFISQLAGVIILGKSHIEIFSGLLDKNKIHVVPNFSEDYLFIDNKAINAKFLNVSSLKIVFMSNLIPGKGYLQLIEAYKALDNDLKIRIQLDFCGNFNSIEEETKFITEIEEFQQVTYHGIVNGDKKKEILNNAHVFCLPTSYYEGQPISILEAYASGC